VAASERADAIVAALAHCSRSQAKEMIRQGLVQLNHITLEEPDELCNNNVTISIRGIGRFVYLGISRKTRNGRIVAEFLKSV
jgi:RNA-binding protein YlmH